MGGYFLTPNGEILSRGGPAVTVCRLKEIPFLCCRGVNGGLSITMGGRLGCCQGAIFPFRRIAR